MATDPAPSPSAAPALTWDEAVATVTADARFALGEVEVDGVVQTVFTNAPATLRQVFGLWPARGDQLFLVYEDERRTFGEVADEVAALGAALVGRYGVRPGDRVAIAMRNLPEWVVAFAAITSIGAVSVSLNGWWTEDELAYGLDDSGSSVLIADVERIDRTRAACDRLGIATLGVRLPAGSTAAAGVDRWEDVVVGGAELPAVEVGPDDDATILYTSGTTGRPKGAVSTHRAVTQSLMSFGCRSQIQRVRRPAEAAVAAATPPVFILVVPLFHVTGGVAVMLSCALGGIPLVIMYKWDPERALELIERERVTNFVGVPTQSWDLMECPRFAEFDTSSLVSVGGGGAPAPPALVARVDQGFSRGRPSIGYGMTETNAFGPQNSGEDYVTHPTSTGRSIPTLLVEVRDPAGKALPVGEQGEIWFKGPMVIKGYWNRPDATAEAIVDGWLRTGDVGRIDAEGFVYVEDRAKDLVLRAGENVSCAEVEAAVYEYPGVYEAAVFGVPHERLGEEVAVAVLPKAGATIDAAPLQAFLRERLAGFKVPSRVVVVDAQLPCNAAGKILKRQLRDEVAADAALSTVRYRDRTHAGEVLAEALRLRTWADPLVLALPRGGVPVAAPVATALGAGLDVLVVRKVGAPERPELALGALAEGRDEVVWGEAVGRRAPDEAAVDAVVAAERAELARRVAAYRGDRAPPAVAGRDVVVVDDGLATGATAEAALRAVRAQDPGSLNLAVPVGPPSTIDRLATIADAVVCPLVRSDLVAVGEWYADFRQTTDHEVLAALR